METATTNHGTVKKLRTISGKINVKRYLLPTLLTVIAILSVIVLPSTSNGASNFAIISLFGSIYIFFLAATFFSGSKEAFKQSVTDITTIVLILLLFWELATNRFGLKTSFIYPTPEAVLNQFQKDGPDLFNHLVSSAGLLASGYLLAVLLAIPLGTLSAWHGRLGRVMSPISSVLAPIPPIILIPYAIAILPSFRASSIFIIFIGAFWPIFVATLNGVSGIDRRYVDSARTLGVSNATLFRKIILPAALPSIFTGLTIGMTLSFILLTSAEMIGANAGVGFYIKLATDFGSYTKVVTGIIFIGIFVTIVMTLLGRLERYLLRWRR